MVKFTETHTKEARKDIHNSCATRQLREKKCIRIEEQPAAGRLTTSSSEVRLKQPLLRTSLIRVTHTVSAAAAPVNDGENLPGHRTSLFLFGPSSKVEHTFSQTNNIRRGMATTICMLEGRHYASGCTRRGRGTVVTSCWQQEHSCATRLVVGLRHWKWGCSWCVDIAVHSTIIVIQDTYVQCPHPSLERRGHIVWRWVSEEGRKWNGGWGIGWLLLLYDHIIHWLAADSGLAWHHHRPCDYYCSI